MIRRIVALVFVPLLTACAPQDDAFPFADAGFSVHGEPGQEYLFDGSASTGSSWTWTLTSRPAASRLTTSSLRGANTPWVSLHADVEGVYVLDLEVCTSAAVCDWSQTTAYVGPTGRQAMETHKLDLPAPGALTLGKFDPDNHAPVAVGTASQGFRASGAVLLQGGNSYDPDGDALRYAWTFASLPAESGSSNASLLNASSSAASFVPDVSGTYIVRLTVMDGQRRNSVLVPVVAKALDDHEPVDFKASRVMKLKGE